MKCMISLNRGRYKAFCFRNWKDGIGYPIVRLKRWRIFLPTNHYVSSTFLYVPSCPEHEHEDNHSGREPSGLVIGYVVDWNENGCSSQSSPSGSFLIVGFSRV